MGTIIYSRVGYCRYISYYYWIYLFQITSMTDRIEIMLKGVLISKKMEARILFPVKIKKKKYPFKPIK